MNVSKKIASVLQTAHAQGNFDGVALVARGSEILHRATYGLANREARTPHTLDTPFPICSVTKQFTALLVMQDVSEGRLRLDGTLSDYLPDFRHDTGKSVSLKNLLMHTSGLRAFDDAPGIFTSRDPRLTDPAYYTQTFCQGELAFAPGSTFRYNNADYIALAAILERVSGATYADLLQKRILRPLSMTRTSLVSPRAPRQVVGYVKGEKGFAPETLVFPLENFGAAGAMQSTADDLLTWDRALDADKLLAPSWRKIMFTPDPAKGYTSFGTWVYSYQKYGTKTPLLFERQGAIGGISVQNLRVPEDRLSVILLSNRDTAALMAYTGKSLTCDLLRAVYETESVK